MNDTDDSMAKEDRKLVILQYLDSNSVALPPKVLYDNLVEYEDITFSYQTVKRLVRELRDEGSLRQLDYGKGYYQITDQGRDLLEEL